MAMMNFPKLSSDDYCVGVDRSYVAYEPIILPYISLILIIIKFIHCHSYVIFVMKFMSICNDKVNYDEILIQRSLVF